MNGRHRCGDDGYSVEDGNFNLLTCVNRAIPLMVEL